MHTVRLAVSADLPRLVEIYNQAISARNATADTLPFQTQMRRGWFDAHSPNVTPIYVCLDEDGGVVGYLAVSAYRDRPALVRTGEISYYVDYSCHGQGIGSALIEYALSDSKRINKKIFLAIVLEWNKISIRLLEKYEFLRWGFLPDVAEFDGRLCGQFYLGREC